MGGGVRGSRAGREQVGGSEGAQGSGRGDQGREGAGREGEKGGRLGAAQREKEEDEGSRSGEQGTLPPERQHDRLGKGCPHGNHGRRLKGQPASPPPGQTRAGPTSPCRWARTALS